MRATADPIATIRRAGIIPIVRVESADIALRVADALIASHLDIIEITMTVPNALEVIASLSRRFGDRVLLGAGTVTDAVTADAAIDAGCHFLVTPCLVPSVIKQAAFRNTPVLGGALTPTEIFASHHMGASLVKVFPSSAIGGPAYLRALRGPFPKIDLVPTGGIGLDLAGEYISAGAVAIGVGGELISRTAIAAGNFAAI